MISLTKEKEAELLESIRKETVAQYVRHLIANGGGTANLSTAQAAGYLNVTTQTLRKLPIPARDVTGNGGTISYRLCDLDEYLEGKEIK